MNYSKIGNLEFSKVICGTNAFYGRSHFSEARDTEYCGRFDDRMIGKMVERCLNCGINAVETSANERIQTLVSLLEEKFKKPVHIIGSTRIDETSAMKSHHQKLDFLIKKRAEVCVIHAQYIDHALKPDGITGLDRMLDKIHEAGLMAGISTHSVKTVELCEQKGYPIDTYLFPLNITGFVYPGYDGKESVQERVALVRGVAKPFIIMKALGAGRIPPDEGLGFVAENMKPGDIVTIGFGTETEIDETVRCMEKYF